MLQRLGMSDPERRLRSYPHELSGGMAKRVLIAMALICDPELLIADEPGAGLDVTVQAQILEHFRSLIRDGGMSAIVITRDLGVVAHYCDQVCVLQAGRVVERSPNRQFFAGPRHRHSEELLAAFRQIAGPAEAADAPAARPIDRRAPLVEIRALRREFEIKWSKAPLVAVDGVSLELFAGETLALVGESGSGKTTVGRCLLRLIEPTAGQVWFEGRDITGLDATALRALRPQIQIVFQDPYNSLNPRRPVVASLTEPLRLWSALDRRARAERARELAALVGLDPNRHLTRYPHQLTSGQQQRVAIARAIALDPKLIVLDEVTSALDPNARAAIIKLLLRLQRESGFAYLFISHDLSVVRQISSRVLVMYLGRIVESGPTEQVFEQPRHPYTRALLGSVLWPDPAQRGRITVLEGEIPSPVNLPRGCYFASRCPLREPACLAQHPPLRELAARHAAACIVAARQDGAR
jgi:oligopeptide/dipeptide ABC transporter ATP-binding protein